MRPTAPASSVYGHGVEITRSVLHGFCKSNNYMIAPHNATNLADIEMLNLLEGDPDALECFKGMVRYLGAQCLEHDLELTGSDSDPRSSAILLQTFSAGTRYNLPYNARTSWGLTWNQAAATMVGKMSQ